MVKQNYSSPPPPPRSVTPKTRQIREFKMQQEHKKAVDLVSESTTLHLRHTFWYIFAVFFLRGLPREIS